MNAALDVLAVLSSIGAKLEPEGDRLILRAGPEAIPAPLVRRVREAKAEILAMLLADDGGAKIVGGEADAHQPIDRAFESLAESKSCAFCAGTVRAVWQARNGRGGRSAVRNRARNTYLASQCMLARMA
jgi:hypothetical protein